MTSLFSWSCGWSRGLGKRGFRRVHGQRSITRQTGWGSLSVVALELLAGSECRAGFSADVDQTLTGLEAGQGLGAW